MVGEDITNEFVQDTVRSGEAKCLTPAAGDRTPETTGGVAGVNNRGDIERLGDVGSSVADAMTLLQWPPLRHMAAATNRL